MRRRNENEFDNMPRAGGANPYSNNNSNNRGAYGGGAYGNGNAGNGRAGETSRNMLEMENNRHINDLSDQVPFFLICLSASICATVVQCCMQLASVLPTRMQPVAALLQKLTHFCGLLVFELTGFSSKGTDDRYRQRS
jgi:hypothetical protein